MKKYLFYLTSALLLVGCDGLKTDDFEVRTLEQYGKNGVQKAISILYKGENSIEIKKVKANKGNCDVYEYNYGAFKDNMNIISQDIQPKLCYLDVLEEINSYFPNHFMYGLGNCSAISELLSKLPEVKIHHISFRPFTQEERELYDKMLKVSKEFSKIWQFSGEEAEKIEQEYKKYKEQAYEIESAGLPPVYYIDWYENAWSKNQNYSKYSDVEIPPYHAFFNYRYLSEEEIKAIRELEKNLYYDYSLELRYGDKAVYGVDNCSKVLDVEITTNKGKIDYKIKY